MTVIYIRRKELESVGTKSLKEINHVETGGLDIVQYQVENDVGGGDHIALREGRGMEGKDWSLNDQCNKTNAVKHVSDGEKYIYYVHSACSIIQSSQ